MPVDPEAQSASLANDYGASKGANAPASHDLYLYAGHPQAGGVQLTTGYTAPTITNDGTSWPAPSGGLLTGAAVTINYTGTLASPATHWALVGSDGFVWDAAEVPEGPWSGGSGTSDTFQPQIRYAGSA